MDVNVCCLTLAVLIGQAFANQEPCYTFNGDGYLKFNVRDNSHHAHYSLTFSTTSPNGILMFSEGPYGDDEALFLRDGKLSYHLFNTSPTGVEGYFGGYFQGDQVVNTDEAVTVHVYRTFNVTDTRQRRVRPQTGLIYTIGGRTYAHIDHRPRQGIALNSEVYIGGYKESLSATVGNFTGKIAAIREEKNGQNFVNFSLNRGGVVLSCLIGFNPN